MISNTCIPGRKNLSVNTCKKSVPHCDIQTKYENSNLLYQMKMNRQQATADLPASFPQCWCKKNVVRLQNRSIHPSIYGATAPSVPWPPSKRASTRHHFLLFSIFSFLIIAMHLSGPRPPIWFLVFPLVLCCRRFHLGSFLGSSHPYVPSAKNQSLSLIAESSSICWTLPRQLGGFHNITFFSGMGLSTPCPTPNLEDQGVPFRLGHLLWPVRHGCPCH